LDRCSGDLVFSNESDTCKNPRLFAIGASHVTRIVGGLADCGIDIVNLAKPGWTLNDISAVDIKKKLLNLNFCSNDILLIDPLSNNTFCGTDSQGSLIDPQKIDNIWHIPGELSIRPKPYIKNILVQLKKIVAAVGPGARPAGRLQSSHRHPGCRAGGPHNRRPVNLDATGSGPPGPGAVRQACGIDICVP
jgi:hypothetical protein